MGKRIAFLGCGKIGSTMLKDVLEQGTSTVSFVQDPMLDEATANLPCPLVKETTIDLLKETDIVVESAIASVLKTEALTILKYCDMMTFSVTAFGDKEFYDAAEAICQEYGTHIYLPHGAIIGIDGLADAGDLLYEVTMETIKPPQALGRTDTERTVLFDGTTRGACEAYPRNVNVHACVALAGVGFDKMKSRIISDPNTTENTHHILAVGEGFRFALDISSFSTSGVTGAYTPSSACGSVRRVAGSKSVFRFV